MLKKNDVIICKDEADALNTMIELSKYGIETSFVYGMDESVKLRITKAGQNDG